MDGFEVAFWGGICTAIVAVFAGLIIGVRGLDHHYGSAQCTSFGRISGRETKFADYTFWQYDCITPAKDGKWISTTNLREFGDAS